MWRQIDGRTLAISAAMLGLAFLLWDTPLLYPLKLFVVLLHELSHGLAAILTGGEVVRVELSALEGGVAYTRGGSRFLILSAGYLGSALWGAAFLRLSAARPRAQRLALLGMGAVLALVAILYVRDLFTFGYTALTAVVLIALAQRAPASWHRWLLYVVGSVSSFYAVVDIGTDILAGGPLTWLFGPSRRNDAEMLAELTWIPAFLWGLLWIGLALGVYLATLRHLTVRQPAGGGLPSGSRNRSLLEEIDRL